MKLKRCFQRVKILLRKSKSDVEWKIYRAKDVPAPGEYWRERNFAPQSPPPSCLEVRKSNSQTTIPSDFTSFVHRTINEQGPNQCRTDSSFGKQIHSEQKLRAQPILVWTNPAGASFWRAGHRTSLQGESSPTAKKSCRRRRERMARSRKSMETSCSSK